MPVVAQLGVTWRVDPGMRGRPPRPVRDAALSDEPLIKLVDEAVAGAARAVLAKYIRADLTHPEARESAVRTTEFVANNALTPRGLWVERVFWRV